MKIEQIREAVEQLKSRSAWDKGIKAYMLELLDNFQEWTEWAKENGEELPELNKKTLLNGAENWKEYSWGANSLIYDCDIAKRLCTQTELKRTDFGNKEPNKREQWLDTQARALSQACNLLLATARAINE